MTPVNGRVFKVVAPSKDDEERTPLKHFKTTNSLELGRFSLNKRLTEKVRSSLDLDLLQN